MHDIVVFIMHGWMAELCSVCILMITVKNPSTPNH